MPDKVYTLEQVLTMLTQTPIRIAALTDGLTPAQLRTASALGEWSANDVLAHLRSCADVWGDSISTILAQDKPTIRAISPRTWVKKTNYRELDFPSSFRAFAAQRAALMAVLESLLPEDWSRAATVTAVGRPYKRTVFNFAHRMAIHEREHVRQVEYIVSTMHT